MKNQAQRYFSSIRQRLGSPTSPIQMDWAKLPQGIAVGMVCILSSIWLFSCELTNEPSAEFGTPYTFLKLYGGADNYVGVGAMPLEDGYIIAGNSQLVTPLNIFSAQNLSGYMYMIRTDLAGNELWSINADTNSYNIATCMTVDLDGNYVMGGATIPKVLPNIADANLRLTKVSASGEVMWIQDYGDLVRNGGEVATDIQVASNGDYLVIGYTTGVSGSSTNLLIDTDIYVLRVSALDGSIVWEKTYGLQSPLADQGIAVREAADGSIIWLGSAQVGAGQTRMRLVKSNADGNVLWDFSYDLDGSEQTPGDLLVTPSGYTVMGSAGDSYALFKTNTNGALLWQNIFSDLGGDLPMPTSLSMSSDGFLLLAGAYRLSGSRDQMVIKANSSTGEKIWHRVYGAGSIDIAQSAVPTADGGILISGTLGFDSNNLISLIKTNIEGKISE